MNRTTLIRRLIETRNYTSYLEIGCQTDATFEKVPAMRKVGVDTVSGGTLRMPSDEFFALAVEPFDLIFIDGDHRHPQVFRDVANALRLLRSGGVIVMHDCLPPTPEHESPDFCGTAWRVFAKIRERLDLDAITLDDDFGVGVVQVKNNTAPISIGRSMDSLTYEDFKRERTRWMRPHTPTQIEQALSLNP